MRIQIALILSTFLFFSCTNKEVKLPQIGMEGETEIQNHSEVWMFYNDDFENPVDLNRNNTISTTHWLYNIDRRIPLQHIIPVLEELKFKHANSMHSEEGMLNYLSYSDTINKKLSYVSFDNIIYKTDSLQSKFFIKENATDYENYNNLNITINPNNTWINDAKMEEGELPATLPDFIEFSAEDRQTMLHLNFNQEITYQEYMTFKAYFSRLSAPSILINPIEFVFDPAKVPDCGCE